MYKLNVEYYSKIIGSSFEPDFGAFSAACKLFAKLMDDDDVASIKMYEDGHLIARYDHDGLPDL